MVRSKRINTEGIDIPETPSIDTTVSGIENTDNADGTSNAVNGTNVIDYSTNSDYIFVGYSGDERQYRKK